jgi:hypothetical protein
MRKQIPTYGTIEYRAWAYERMKEANKGHNFEYYNQEKHGKLLSSGYKFYKFKGTEVATSAEGIAKDIVTKLREEGNYARIICGYEQNVQRIKMFSVIFKSK